MESEGIIGSIHRIYGTYNVPKNVQEHMMRVAATAELICDNWKGPVLNKNDVVAMLLLHDLGNIVKMDFETKEGLEMFGSEAKRVDYWKRVRKEMISKYGSEEHAVTEKMVDEIGIPERVRALLVGHIFKNNENILTSDDWEMKIAAYADQRVSPLGVLTVRERLNEAKERYARTGRRIPDLDSLMGCSLKIEKQLLRNLSLSEKEINDKAIQKYMKKY